MTSVHIKKRRTKPDKDGKTKGRWIVYYRLGGREAQQRYAGSYDNPRDAKTRHDLIAGELAAGRDPRLLLEALKKPAVPPPGLLAAYDSFIASRIDVSPSTDKLYKNSRDKLVPLLGETTDPASITTALIQAAVNTVSGALAPDTVKQYLSTLRQVLAHAEVDPNPAASPKLRLPARDEEEIAPPSTAEWHAVRATLAKKYLLLTRLLECLGLRIGEALKLTWGDIDWVEERIRVSRARTKTRSGQRWLPVPGVLLDELAALVPLEDRVATRPVFPIPYTTFKKALDTAVTLAGVPAFSPHDLRHRRISLWFAHGVDPIQVRTWAGHAKASMSSDVYGHVLIDASADEWRSFWVGEYRGDGIALEGRRHDR